MRHRINRAEGRESADRQHAECLDDRTGVEDDLSRFLRLAESEEMRRVTEARDALTAGRGVRLEDSEPTKENTVNASATTFALFPASIALMTLLVSSPAHADWWQDCAAERQKFCQGVQAGGGRIVTCLDQHESELSTQCKLARQGTSGLGGKARPTPPSSSAPSPSSSTYRIIFQTTWASGLDSSLMYQAPTRESISVSDTAGGRALRISISQRDSYAGVANGVPRAEVSFGTRVRFHAGRDYAIQWTTLIPGEYAFDSRQPEGITQIHQGPAQGTPPLSVTLNNDRYVVDLRSGGSQASEHEDIGSASADKGRWVRWILHYVPDGSGANAVTELYKDGRKVLERRGTPNAYPGDDHAYFKIGVYKWWWQSRPSDVTERTMYFGDVQIAERRDSPPPA